MFGVALFGGILTVVGVFLPWMQVGALLVNRGIDNPDGAIALGIGIGACALALFGLLRAMQRRSARSSGRTFRFRTLLGIALILAAIVLFITGFIDLRDVQSRVADAGETVFGDVASVGSGLYMLLVGAVVLGIGGLGSLLRRPEGQRGSNELEASVEEEEHVGQ